MGGLSHMASEVEFPKVPLIDIKGAQKSHTASNAKLIAMKNRKTVVDNN